MSVSVIVTDCVMLNCTKKKKLYLQMIQLDETKIRDKVLDLEENEIDLINNKSSRKNDYDDDDDKPTCRL